MGRILKVSIRQLAEEAGNVGSVVSYRPVGAKVKELLDKIAKEQLHMLDMMELDFANVDNTEPSFIDSAIVMFKMDTIAKKNNIFYLSNLNSYVQYAVENCISWYLTKKNESHPLLWRTNDDLQVIGHLENKIAELFNMIKQEDVTARRLAELEKINVNNASTRLKKLYDLKLVLRREIMEDGARQQLYYLPKLLTSEY
ncbi:MAG: hypothetical protein H6Q65_305 [Firmicutes bacterium]|nr:hypothetical protein [Bacillota bacterium]